MANKGQRSVTLHADIVERAKQYFLDNQEQFEMRNIRSTTALIEAAMIDYMNAHKPNSMKERLSK